jgi:TPR repeat protein
MYFEASDYREAFNALLPLAAEGNRDAEYALGYLYYYGYGVTQDTATGIFWIKKSAAQGYEPAMLALKSLH